MSEEITARFAEGVIGAIRGRIYFPLGLLAVSLGAAALSGAWMQMRSLWEKRQLIANFTQVASAELTNLYWELTPETNPFASKGLGGLIPDAQLRLSFDLKLNSSDGGVTRHFVGPYRKESHWSDVALPFRDFLPIPRIEIRVEPAYYQRLNGTKLDDLRRSLDSPLETLTAQWLHPLPEQAIPVAYAPGKPTEFYPVAYLKELASRSNVLPLFIVIFMIVWGSGFLAGGLGLAFSDRPPLHLLGFFLAVLITTPLWSRFYERLANHYLGERSMIGRALRADLDPDQDRGHLAIESSETPQSSAWPKLSYSFHEGSAQAFFKRFQLIRSGRSFKDAAAVRAALIEDLRPQVAKLDELQLADHFKWVDEELRRDRSGLASLFTGAARDLSVDQNRSENARAWVIQALGTLTLFSNDPVDANFIYDQYNQSSGVLRPYWGNALVNLYQTAWVKDFESTDPARVESALKTWLTCQYLSEADQRLAPRLRELAKSPQPRISELAKQIIEKKQLSEAPAASQ